MITLTDYTFKTPIYLLGEVAMLQPLEEGKTYLTLTCGRALTVTESAEQILERIHAPGAQGTRASIVLMALSLLALLQGDEDELQSLKMTTGADFHEALTALVTGQLEPLSIPLEAARAAIAPVVARLDDLSGEQVQMLLVSAAKKLLSL